MTDQLQIETTQNIDIEHTLASIGERFLALLIDWLIFFFYFLFIIGFIRITQIEGLIFTLIASMPVIFYHLVCELTMEGQSWGKRVVRIRVVKLDGSEPGFLDFFIRWLFRLLENSILFGSLPTLLLIIRGKGQRLGDIVAGTTVIRQKVKTSLSGILQGSSYEEGYVPKFPSAVNLTDSDINTLQEVLDYIKRVGVTNDSYKVVSKTQVALEKELEVSSNLDPLRFLEAVLKDYEFLYRK